LEPEEMEGTYERPVDDIEYLERKAH
jgi:hypothetical protein